jgi:hypothetical protein
MSRAKLLILQAGLVLSLLVEVVDDVPRNSRRVVFRRLKFGVLFFCAADSASYDGHRGAQLRKVVIKQVISLRLQFRNFFRLQNILDNNNFLPCTTIIFWQAS